eukprot:2690374-Rhodomonas_salina.2
MIYAPLIPVVEGSINNVKNVLHGTNYFGAAASPFLYGPTQRLVRALNPPVVNEMPQTVMAMVRVVPNSLASASSRVATTPLGV